MPDTGQRLFRTQSNCWINAGGTTRRDVPSDEHDCYQQQPHSRKYDRVGWLNLIQHSLHQSRQRHRSYHTTHYTDKCNSNDTDDHLVHHLGVGSGADLPPSFLNSR